MWVHIVIFALAAGTVLLSRAEWIYLEPLKDKKGLRLFLTVAVCMNLVGTALTIKENSGNIQQGDCRLPREENSSYQEEYLVAEEGEEEKESLIVQVPEKETGEEAPEPLEEPQEKTKQQQLQEMLEQYNLKKQDPDYYYLPSRWKGRKLIWERPREHSGELLASMGLFAAFAVLLKNTREKQENEQKKAEQLLMDYPGLVMKFTLLIQAGMSARKAFRKIASDYQRRTPEGGRFAYEAIVTACHEMDSGIAESDAYRRFGEQCGQMKYKTFSTLLIQNLQKGSRCLADILEKETLDAWEERKRKARVLGETAAMKLLVPMVMMLAVVMAVIMIPAFLSFYG